MNDTQHGLVPEQAVTAAAQAIERELMSGKDYSMALDSDEALARAALEAAAPAIREQAAAAERDRIRQLAIEQNARCCSAMGASLAVLGAPFADLLGGGS